MWKCLTLHTQFGYFVLAVLGRKPQSLGIAVKYSSFNPYTLGPGHLFLSEFWWFLSFGKVCPFLLSFPIIAIKMLIIAPYFSFNVLESMTLMFRVMTLFSLLALIMYMYFFLLMNLIRGLSILLKLSINQHLVLLIFPITLFHFFFYSDPYYFLMLALNFMNSFLTVETKVITLGLLCW